MNMFDEIDVGKNIKKVRMEKGITQIELGKRISKSESTIRKYEAGSVKVTMDIISKIAKALETPVGKFLETEPISIEDIELWDKKLYLSKATTQELIEELNNRNDFPIKINIK